LVIAVVGGGILAIFVYLMLWIPLVTLDFIATRSSAERREGSVIGGIAWKPAFGEAHLVIVNGSDHDVQDLDVVFRPDQPIAFVGQVTNLPNVAIAPHDVPSVDPQWISENGQRRAMDMSLLATSRGYRIRGEVPRRSRLEIVIAAVRPNDAGDGSEGNKLLRIDFPRGESVWFAHRDHSDRIVFGLKPVVVDVVIEGKYSVSERRHQVLKSLTAADFATAFDLP
jgi:hypothetical protein